MDATKRSHDKVCERTNQRKGLSSKLVVIGIFGGVFALWLLSWAFIYIFVSEDKRGVFGDMFGAINSLFSGLAFGGVVYAILLQRQELELQREELRLSRQELSIQNQIMNDQLRAMQDSIEFERHKETVTSEPFLQFQSASSGAALEKIRFVNVGADVREVQIEVVEGPDGAKASIEPDFIGHNQKCQITLTDFGPIDMNRRHPEMRVRLTYLDKLNQRRSKNYLFPAGSFNAQEIPT